MRGNVDINLTGLLSDNLTSRIQMNRNCRCPLAIEPGVNCTVGGNIEPTCGLNCESYDGTRALPMLMHHFDNALLPAESRCPLRILPAYKKKTC